MAAADAWVPAYVGIGSNLDGPVARVRAAFAALGELRDTRLEACSSLYAGPPLDGSDQPEYVNAVAGLLTRLAPEALLAALLGIEARAGRVRDAALRWAPRTLDLDLLGYGERRVRAVGLEVPHPGVATRNFVLLPLAEVAPGLWLPGVGPVAAAAQRLPAGPLRRLGSP